MEKEALRNVIRPLPEAVASRIAAGEVIERPASVLKELLENSLDAGARKISVEIMGAGRRLLRVSDDGCGLSQADCRAAFLRHTTSKIADLADLDTLETFGFRGEALFSIAAVSNISLTTRVKTSPEAWRIELAGGKVVKEHEAPPVSGTVIEVRDLFFNTPARAKFLKSDGTERGQIARVIEEAALAHPDAAFTLKMENKIKAEYPARKGGGEKALRARTADVLGETYGRDLLFSQREQAGILLRAFHSAAENLHATRGLQYVFVNRRPVANRTIQQALYRAYEPFRSRSRHPAAALFLELPAASVDVNVHPTKREVRFKPDSAVYQLVVQALSRTLLESKNIPTLSISPEKTATVDGTPTAPPDCGYPPAELRSFPAYARESGEPRLSGEPSRRNVGAERIWHAENARYLGQIERSYLIFEAAGGLLLVDQHAAQEKILFERYMAELAEGRPQTQALMLPLAIDLPASAMEKILTRKKRLRRAGFTVEAYGKTTLHVVSVPSVFQKARDIKEVVHGLLDGLMSPAAVTADIRYDATAAIACKTAVKAHDALSDKEALALLKELKDCKDATCCPHGRPTMLRLDRGELARRFGRPGPPPLE